MRLSQRLRLHLGRAAYSGLVRIEQGVFGPVVDLQSATFANDPYTVLGALRDKDPLHYSMAFRGWWATDFELVREILRDSRFGADVRAYERRAARIKKQLQDDPDRLAAFENPSMLSLDPPDHSRIRRLVSRGFVHKFIASLEPRIQRIVDDCLARVANQSEFDLIDVLAKPLPAIVIAEMMGLPESDHQQFQDWSEDLIAGTSTSNPEVLERSNRANQALTNYFERIIKTRDADPEGDLIGQLIAAEEAGDKLNALELYNTCLLLLVAGHETTTRLIGNGMYVLLQAPDQLRQLTADPSLIPTAVEEMLRFESPVQATQRFVREDLQFHGKRMKKGDIVFVSIAAANRDPKANDDPDRFDVTRASPSHVSFGYGIHMCIGASLARLEAKVAFETLLARFPDIALGNTPKWGANPFFRGFDELKIRLGGGSEQARQIA